MKRQNIQDERAVEQRRKIYSEAYGILMFALLASIIVQQLLNAPFEQYAVESICFLGLSIYVITRYMTLGLNLYGEVKRGKYISLMSSI